ncbi:MAG: tRNA lysidine(34) synthetase TilS [Bacteroidia bacterium]
MLKEFFLANHADDQIEGFFIELKLHNSLAGMSENENFRLRPFLNCFKHELEEFAKQNRINWREDKSNSKTDYLRNKIRLELLPELIKYDPEIKQDILKSVTRQKSEKDALSVLMEKHLKLHREPDRNGVKYQKQAFDIFRDPLPLIAFILAEYDVSGGFLSQIAVNLTNTHTCSFLTSRVKVTIDRSYLSVFQINTEDNMPNVTSKPDLMIEEIRGNALIPLIFSRFEAFVNPKKLPAELVLRKGRNGDRFYPSGMTGSKLLSDFFTDNKYSREEKENQWLLCSGDDIVWVVNQRVDERFRWREGDESAWHIKIAEG